MLKRIGVLACVAIVSASACSGSDEATPATAEATEPTAGVSEVSSDADGAGEPTASIDEFCEQFVLLQGEQPESYVGSQEQREDVGRLQSVAPDAVSADIATFSAYLSSGAIDSQADPDSNLTENWPQDVQTAVADIQAFAADTC